MNLHARQLTLTHFYTRNYTHLEYKPSNFGGVKKTKQRQLKLQELYGQDCSHFGSRPWYFRRPINHLLYVFDTAYRNNRLLPVSAQQESIFEYVAVEKFYSKIVESQFVNDMDDIINYTNTSVEYSNQGTSQQDNFNKLIIGYIRLKMEEIYDLQMPYYLAMIVLGFYGKIMMISKILSLNHMNIIQYTLNQLIPTVMNIKFHQTLKFHDVRHSKNIFLAIIKTNTDDIVAFYVSRKISFSILLNTSILSIPVQYKMHEFDIYHFPNNFEINYTHKLADIFIQLKNSNSDPKMCIAGIGSLAKHNLNSNTLLMLCSEYEVFQLD